MHNVWAMSFHIVIDRVVVYIYYKSARTTTEIQHKQKKKNCAHTFIIYAFCKKKKKNKYLKQTKKPNMFKHKKNQQKQSKSTKKKNK